ncbi:L,D-transpeptidase family protein [Pseudoflavitalea sp. G-6-1-2]|uniref:L,D-transpeptidase family protein n=1 Tax=Pseudoflavitalea sp. G-6-1-2 TaxID=2728841 RepID=UPI00146E874A|nr:L,D-transpeptidase family protein [Pseudoflavitalea sp. G-6-1-2]NML23240.1 L,D-transpeptidase family protein [Pseudoflavitalea sp. G-6-1-2]
MNKHLNAGTRSCMFVFLLALAACGGGETEKPKVKDIVESPEKFEARVKENLTKALSFMLDNKGRLNDTVVLADDVMVNEVYVRRDHQPIWSAREQWNAIGESFFQFIAKSKEYGLFPSDYHFRALQGIRTQIERDTQSRRDAALWSRADLMMTDAFLLAARHLKQGHFKNDSAWIRTDSALGPDFYPNVLANLINTRNLNGVIKELEPTYAGYAALKEGLKSFLDSIQTFKRYTKLYYSYPLRDSVEFYHQLQRRLFEDDLVVSATEPLDTTMWRQVLTDYQKSKGLKPTGRINENTVNSLNYTSWDKFKRVAITLDRYKMATDSFPETYIWVNLPSFYLRVYDADTVALESRIIVGQSRTRTPLLTSAISNFITYPQWTVPYSIIYKEMLPKIKQNVDYLRKQNLMVVDRNDSILDPALINWAALGKGNFPYLLKQRQGDDNSLGVLKFNFPNKYDVYLHDTNARWLFSNGNRAMSHGCVRVKEFMKLADFLVRNDTAKYHPDTLRAWIKREEKHTVWGFKKVPIYIRYFTCEGKDGKLKIYEDIYGEDKILRERYFADKAVQ